MLDASAAAGDPGTVQGLLPYNAKGPPISALQGHVEKVPGGLAAVAAASAAYCGLREPQRGPRCCAKKLQARETRLVLVQGEERPSVWS